MADTAYLIENPPARSQYRKPRREQESGVVVVHTAESTPDTVATDGGAEAVARFIQGRSDPGSYHRLNDSDSSLLLVPYEYEAFGDGTGSNPHAVHLSVATTAAWWPLAPASWRAGAITQLAHGAADYARWLRARRGIVIPARRITRAESDRRVPGFLSHAERDPARRSDPGPAFPWDAFLEQYHRLMAGGTITPTPTTEDDMPAFFVRRRTAVGGDTKRCYLIEAGERVHVNSPPASKVICDDRPDIRHAGRDANGVPRPLVWNADHVNIYTPRRGKTDA